MIPEIAFIARCDDVIADWNLKRITIDTSYGPVDRCYVGNVFDKEILIVYGRFNGQKVPSSMINYQQNIEAVKNMGCHNLIGTFTVGGIVPERPAGTVYVLGDLVGMGNYDISVNQRTSFHNAEMYRPFCPNLTEMLNKAADKMNFEVIRNAVYVCFHGFCHIPDIVGAAGFIGAVHGKLRAADVDAWNRNVRCGKMTQRAAARNIRMKRGDHFTIFRDIAQG